MDQGTGPSSRREIVIVLDESTDFQHLVFDPRISIFITSLSPQDFNLYSLRLRIEVLPCTPPEEAVTLLQETVQTFRRKSYYPLILSLPPLQHPESTLAWVRFLLYQRFGYEIVNFPLLFRSRDQKTNSSFFHFRPLVRTWSKTPQFNSFTPLAVDSYGEAAGLFAEREKESVDFLYVNPQLEEIIGRELEWELLDQFAPLGDFSTPTSLGGDPRSWYSCAQLSAAQQKRIFSLAGLPCTPHPEVAALLEGRQEKENRQRAAEQEKQELLSQLNDQYLSDSLLQPDIPLPEEILGGISCPSSPGTDPVPFLDSDEQRSVMAGTERLQDQKVWACSRFVSRRSASRTPLLPASLADQYQELGEAYGYRIEQGAQGCYFFPPRQWSGNCLLAGQKFTSLRSPLFYTVDLPDSWLPYTLSRIHRHLPPLVYVSGFWQRNTPPTLENRARLVYWCRYLLLKFGLWDPEVNTFGKVFPDLSLALLAFSFSHLEKILRQLHHCLSLTLKTVSQEELQAQDLLSEGRVLPAALRRYPNLIPVKLGSLTFYFYTPQQASLQVQKYSWKIKSGKIEAELQGKHWHFWLSGFRSARGEKERYLGAVSHAHVSDIHLLLSELNDAWHRGEFLSAWGKYYYLRTGQLSTFPLVLPPAFQTV